MKIAQEIQSNEQKRKNFEKNKKILIVDQARKKRNQKIQNNYSKTVSNNPFSSDKYKKPSKNMRNMSQADLTKSKNNYLEKGKLKYYIRKGNNFNLMKRLIEKRGWWESIENQELEISGKDLENANFIWTPTTKNIDFRGRISRLIYQKQLINHYPNHPEISSKMNLFMNLHRICSKHNLNVFDFLPITFVFNCEDPNFFHEIDHFFRYFKGLTIFNHLQNQENKLKPSLEENFENPENETNNLESIDLLKKAKSSDKEILDLMNSQIIKSNEDINQSNEYTLRPLIIKIAQKNKAFKIKNKLNNKSKVNPFEDPEEILFKKLSQIMNYPGHNEDEEINKIFGEISENSIIEESKTFKSKQSELKWNYISRFQRNLFNKNKKLVKIPEPKNLFNCYYSTTLPKSFNTGKNLWLLKVCQYNRGFGIELFKELKSFTSHLCNFKMGYEENLLNELPQIEGTKEISHKKVSPQNIEIKINKG